MMVPVGKEYQVFLTVHSPVRYDGYLLKSVKLLQCVNRILQRVLVHGVSGKQPHGDRNAV